MQQFSTYIHLVTLTYVFYGSEGSGSDFVNFSNFPYLKSNMKFLIPFTLKSGPLYLYFNPAFQAMIFGNTLSSAPNLFNSSKNFSSVIRANEN